MEIKNINREDRENLISISRVLERENYPLSAEWLDGFIDRIKGE